MELHNIKMENEKLKKKLFEKLLKRVEGKYFYSCSLRKKYEDLVMMPMLHISPKCKAILLKLFNVVHMLEHQYLVS